MPRKPKPAEKQRLAVVVNDTPINVILHPPKGKKRCWYAYWAGAVYSRSTGHSSLDQAKVAADDMVRTWASGGTGHCARINDFVLTDEEFEAIQTAYYDRKTDPVEKGRSEKFLLSCLEAIRAFQAIAELKQVALATPDDCARFQRDALKKPKNWRQQFPRGTKPEDADQLSPNTVLKWSRALQAAYERANRNAGKKCVRGIVPESKLLASNPWIQFTWIEGRDKPIRQFDPAEIYSLLDYFEKSWTGVTVASIMVKVLFWSVCRKLEAASLDWSALRLIGEEVHFRVVGKWGVERWFRIPWDLYQQLRAIQTNSPYVFAAYNDQLRRFHERQGRLDIARRVGNTFSPQCLGDWLADRFDDWSSTLPKGPASLHVTRKTASQAARDGENVNKAVADDLRVGESVMTTSYVKETDESLRLKSNRTFQRIPVTWPPDLQRRFGLIEGIRRESDTVLAKSH